MPRRSSSAGIWDVTDIGDARSDYDMAKRSGAQRRQRRGIPAQGAGADYHYRNETDWLWMQELAWDIYRNDMIVGSIVDRAVEYCIQDGFTFDAQTGDQGLDKDLEAWWLEISDKPELWDPEGELAFVDMEEQIHRSTLVGGDIFPCPQPEGTMLLRESHLCRSPSRRVKENIVHGVEKEPIPPRRRKNYWFLDEPISAYQAVRKGQLTATPAYIIHDLTELPERNVFHVRYPKRVSQTRGLTAFAPLFTPADYRNDIEFLTLVQKRAASFFAFVEERSAEFDPKYMRAEMKIGRDVTDEKATAEEIAANDRQYKEAAPGGVLRGLPGAKLRLDSANVPAPEHLPYVRMLLTYIGLNLGMPLVMVLMDASETNFSGIRGAVDMARNGFRRMQRRLIARFHMPAYRFKLLVRAERDRAVARQIKRSLRPGAKVNIFRHRWNTPSWPYIQPVEDATADLIRDSNMQTSPRRRCHERNYIWGEIVDETIEDRGSAIEKAIERAAQINTRYKLDGAAAVAWRDLAPLPMPERTSVRVNVSETTRRDQTSSAEE